jgi:glutamate-1-semialdehyde 2,1-aminomutase
MTQSLSKSIQTGRPKTEQVYRALCRVIPGGVNSPVRSFPGLSLTPLIVAKAAGDRLWDVDGHSYIDMCGSWGALILGHAPACVLQAATEQLQCGSSYGASTAIEERLASLIVHHMPSIEKIRFVSSGTEAVMTAVRLARGFTGRSKIVKFEGNYHGHMDSFLIKAGSGVAHLNPTASSKGVPASMVAHTVTLTFNNLEETRAALRQLDDLAGVIIEPIAANMGVVPATRPFLEMLREECTRKGAVLIFDEVISGFRVGLSGAQGFYGIEPDLTTLGKIIGAGFPAAACGGAEEIMNQLAPLGQVYQAGTLSGNPVAMAAGVATVLELQQPGIYDKLKEMTDLLTRPIQEAMKDRQPACLQQVGSMFTPFLGIDKVEKKEKLADDLYRRLFVYLFEHGVYIPPSPYEAWFVSTAHTKENLELVRDLILQFLKEQEAT